MSDFINCDVCSKSGRRKMFKHCPEGWLYGEFLNDDDPESAFVVSVCSEECARRFFVPGPGDLNTSPEYVTNRSSRKSL